MPPIDVNEKSLINILIDELQRRDYSSEVQKDALELLSNEEVKAKIQEIIKIDKEKVERAIVIKNNVDSLTNEIVSYRYRVNEASKIIGKRIFEDNSETARISHNLKERQVTDQDSLHLFIDDLHKYIVQSANWDDLYKKPHIQPSLRLIEAYRNSFDHIYDMKGGGDGSKKAYKELGNINEKLIGHKVIKIEEYSILQIKILECVKKMLRLLDENIEDWLK